jgi:poly-beta-1,6-N-acetyl-D-glucosamine synthase
MSNHSSRSKDILKSISSLFMHQTSDNNDSLPNPTFSYGESFPDEVLQQYNRDAVSNALVSISKKDTESLTEQITSTVKKFAPVTVIIPAYNEESVIGMLLSNLIKQSVLPERIIVIDDFSSDRTGEIAKHFDGVTVARTPGNMGSKGHALNYGLRHVDSKYTITIDADIALEENAIQKMVEFMELQQDVSVACSFVLPKRIKTIWDHSRLVEYLFSFTFYKNVQQLYRSIIIASGCFTIYKTQDLKSMGGWPTRTAAEDMDLTWLYYEKGKRVSYVKDATCFAIEPENFHLMSKQLKRWNTGFHQVLQFRWKSIMKVPVLREFIISALIDSFIGTFFYLFIIYLSVSSGNPLRCLAFFALDIILVAVPSLWMAIKIRKCRQFAKSFPRYLIVRYLNLFWFYYGFISVWILKKATLRFEKGH